MQKIEVYIILSIIIIMIIIAACRSLHIISTLLFMLNTYIRYAYCMLRKEEQSKALRKLERNF